MDLGSLFNTVSGMLNQHTREDENVDTDSLIGKIGNVFREHGASEEQTVNPYAQDQSQGILPASQDPLGDPADDAGQGILPASQDPLGDPADQR